MKTVPARPRFLSPGPPGVRRSLLVMAAAALLLAGCAPKVIPTGTLPSYADFDFVNRRDVKIRRGPNLTDLKRLEARPGAAAAKTAPTSESTTSTLVADQPSTKLLVFVIEPVQWTAGDVYTGDAREKLQSNARESLLYWTGENYPYPVIYRYGVLRNDPLLFKADVVFVESTISYVRKGFAPARFPAIAILGLGAVSIQLEGRLHLQSPSGPVIAQFAVRSRTNGAPEGGNNDMDAFIHGFFWGLGVYPKMYSNLYCLKFGLIEDGYKLLPHIKNLIPPPPSTETKP